MGKKNYVKLCEGCMETFVGSCNGNCPWCGSTKWRHVDRQGVPLPDIGHDTMRRVIERVPMDNGEVLMLTSRVRAVC